MKKQNGFGLILLLIGVAIIAFILLGADSNSGEGKDGDAGSSEVGSSNVEKKSVLENQLNSIKKAEEAKRILEDRDANTLQY